MCGKACSNPGAKRMAMPAVIASVGPAGFLPSWCVCEETIPKGSALAEVVAEQPAPLGSIP